MFTGKLHRSGDSFIVTIPREEIERLGLTEGQLVALDVRPAEVPPALAADLRDALQIELDRGQEALRYLAEH